MVRRKHALLIGIDSYPEFPRGADLAGARADAECMEALLVEHMGFATEDVEVLTDADATREGIIAGLERLLARTGAGDVVWFHFSGHGSRRNAKRGWFRADGKENVLVPHDSAHDGSRPNMDISGNELHGWLRYLSARTQRVTLVLDCCHAGTMTREDTTREDERDLERGRLRTVTYDTRAPQPQPFPWSSLDRELPAPGESGWCLASESYTLMAACRADQRAREIVLRERGQSRRVHGALSHALLMALRDPSKPTTYAALLATLTAAVRGRYPDQHPQLEGPAGRRLLRLATAPTDRSRTIIERDGGRLALDGGAVQGVVPGSIWSIMPPDVPSKASVSPSLDGSSNKNPMARVTRVDGVRSDAVLLGDAATATDVQVGWRATLRNAGHAAPVLRVAIEVPRSFRTWAASVVTGVDGSPALRRELDPTRADVVVAVVRPQDQAREHHRARTLSSLDRPVVAVVDGDDNVVVPLRWRVDGLAAADTVAALEALVRYRHMRILRNPASSVLDGTVETSLMRRAPQAFPWAPATPSRAGGPVSFDHREPFALTLSNRGSDAVYVHVVAVGVGGGIGVVFPRGAACEALAPGNTVWVGERPGESLWFEVPETVPFEHPGARPWEGEEILLTIVTDDATDLRPLFQGSFRDAAWQHTADANALAAVLGDVLSHGYREGQSGTEPRDVAWSVDRLVVALRRPRDAG